MSTWRRSMCAGYATWVGTPDSEVLTRAELPARRRISSARTVAGWGAPGRFRSSTWPIASTLQAENRSAA